MNRSRTPDETVRFILNKDDTIFFPEYHHPVEEVETPKISIPFSLYKAIHIAGERRVGRIRPVPWYEPRVQRQ